MLKKCNIPFDRMSISEGRKRRGHDEAGGKDMQAVHRETGIRKFIRRVVFGVPAQKFITAGDMNCRRMLPAAQAAGDPGCQNRRRRRVRT